MLEQDPGSRVACETLVTTGLALIAGEVTSRHRPLPDVVREHAFERIGYTTLRFGFDCDDVRGSRVDGQQSPDIAMGVDRVVPETRA